jgi:hypothetical protein
VIQQLSVHDQKIMLICQADTFRRHVEGSCHLIPDLPHEHRRSHWMLDNGTINVNEVDQENHRHDVTG